MAHLVALARPGGAVYQVDADPDLADLADRYAAWHLARGNDLTVGRRLGALLEAAGAGSREHRRDAVRHSSRQGRFVMVLRIIGIALAIGIALWILGAVFQFLVVALSIAAVVVLGAVGYATLRSRQSRRSLGR